MRRRCSGGDVSLTIVDRVGFFFLSDFPLIYMFDSSFILHYSIFSTCKPGASSALVLMLLQHVTPLRTGLFFYRLESYITSVISALISHPF